MIFYLKLNFKYRNCNKNSYIILYLTFRKFAKKIIIIYYVSSPHAVYCYIAVIFYIPNYRIQKACSVCTYRHTYLDFPNLVQLQNYKMVLFYFFCKGFWDDNLLKYKSEYECLFSLLITVIIKTIKLRFAFDLPLEKSFKRKTKVWTTNKLFEMNACGIWKKKGICMRLNPFWRCKNSNNWQTIFYY